MKAVVLHSGGMDSSICLKLAINEYGADHVHAVGFSYGQRHSTELKAAEKICAAWGVQRSVFELGILQQLTHNALMDRETAIEHRAGKPANTLVVGRNGLIVHLGGIFAEHIGASSLWCGVIQRPEETSGYRDCSRGYMDLQQQILRIDLDQPAFELRTPLVDMTKEDTLFLAERLGILDFLLAETVTCYEGIPREGCGKCPSCLLRTHGLEGYWTKKRQFAAQEL